MEEEERFELPELRRVRLLKEAEEKHKKKLEYMKNWREDNPEKVKGYSKRGTVRKKFRNIFDNM